MAATRLIALHIQKGKTMHQCIKDRTDYAENGEKTDDGRLVSSYGCNPDTADMEFAATKKEYELLTGRRQREKDVIAYMIRQSFKPGEITPEEANRIGYETAMRWTKGKHAFIVATHTDKAHIHNHIVYNSTTLDANRKFKNFWLAAIALRKLSDLICLENGLSVIEAKRPSEWEKRTTYPKRDSFRDIIKSDIDEVLVSGPENYEAFLKTLREKGYEIKRGKYDSLKGTKQERYIRFRSLGVGYTDEDIKKRILGEAVVFEKATSKKSEESVPNKQKKNVDLLLDMQEIIAKGKGAGYEQWAKVYNIKQMAKTIMFMSEQGIHDYDVLVTKVDETVNRFNVINEKLRTTEKRIEKVKTLKMHIVNYVKAKDVFEAYKKSGYNKDFFEEHRELLLLRKAAKEAFEKMNGEIPKVKDLNVELEELLEEKKELYSEYKKLKEEKQEYLIAKANVEQMYSAKEHEEEIHNRKKLETYK